MQTLACTAKKVLRWNRESTRFGGYRLTDARVEEAAPADLDSYTDCTSDEQFADELGTAHRLLGLSTTPGFWLGMIATTETCVKVVALLLE